MLSDGRAYVLGKQPGWCDILAWFPIWMCRGNIADADELIGDLPAVLSWEARMATIGYGAPTPLDAKKALAIASSNTSVSEPLIEQAALPALAVGTQVTVTPDDYGAVPVAGELLRLTQYDVAITRSDPKTGDVVVHFPRIGYRVDPV